MFLKLLHGQQISLLYWYIVLFFLDEPPPPPVPKSLPPPRTTVTKKVITEEKQETYKRVIEPEAMEPEPLALLALPEPEPEPSIDYTAFERVITELYPQNKKFFLMYNKVNTTYVTASSKSKHVGGFGLQRKCVASTLASSCIRHTFAGDFTHPHACFCSKRSHILTVIVVFICVLRKIPQT